MCVFVYRVIDPGWCSQHIRVNLFIWNYRPQIVSSINIIPAQDCALRATAGISHIGIKYNTGEKKKPENLRRTDEHSYQNYCNHTHCKLSQHHSSGSRIQEGEQIT